MTWPASALPACTRHEMRRVRTRVLPDPAPASTHRGWASLVTAARWAGLRSSSSADGLATATPIEHNDGV